jgi:hypothetical protein
LAVAVEAVEIEQEQVLHLLEQVVVQAVVVAVYTQQLKLAEQELQDKVMLVELAVKMWQVQDLN